MTTVPHIRPFQAVKDDSFPRGTSARRAHIEREIIAIVVELSKLNTEGRVSSMQLYLR